MTEASADVVLPMLVTITKLPHDAYMGRSRRFTKTNKGGYWGNPFQDEEWAANFSAMFQIRLLHDEEFLMRTLALRGLSCACFCKPNPCHADIIATWVNAQPLVDCMAAIQELERLKLDRRNSEGKPLLAWFNSVQPELAKIYADPEAQEAAKAARAARRKQ